MDHCPQSFVPWITPQHVWVGVTDCNRNGSGLQSAHFPDHILCIYPPPQDRIKVLGPFW